MLEESVCISKSVCMSKSTSRSDSQSSSRKAQSDIRALSGSRSGNKENLEIKCSNPEISSITTNQTPIQRKPPSGKSQQPNPFTLICVDDMKMNDRRGGNRSLNLDPSSSSENNDKFLFINDKFLIDDDF